MDLANCFWVGALGFKLDPLLSRVDEGEVKEEGGGGRGIEGTQNLKTK